MSLCFCNLALFFVDVEPYLSPMFTHLINEKAIPSLKCLYIDFSLYYWKVSVELLRAFTITLVSELPDKDRFFLYEKCVERGIYKAYNVSDSPGLSLNCSDCGSVAGR